MLTNSNHNQSHNRCDTRDTRAIERSRDQDIKMRPESGRRTRNSKSNVELDFSRVASKLTR